MSSNNLETSADFLEKMSRRSTKESTRSGATKPVGLGFLDLITSGDSRPLPDTDYKIIVASSAQIADLDYPKTSSMALDIDLYEFYSANLPDFWGSNEGLIQLEIDTKNPQDITGDSKLASFATEFSVKDGDYARGFLYRGIFRNVIIENWTNLGIDLFELDKDSVEYYKKIKGIIDEVPEIKNIDVLKGIPYLDVATKLFDGIIRTFGKNPDDHIWGEIPILEVDPIIGGAFLRSGIYIVYESPDDLPIEDLVYRNGKLRSVSDAKLTNHLIFGLRLKPYKNS